MHSPFPGTLSKGKGLPAAHKDEAVWAEVTTSKTSSTEFANLLGHSSKCQLKQKHTEEKLLPNHQAGKIMQICINDQLSSN